MARGIDASVLAELESLVLRPFHILNMSSVSSLFTFTDCQLSIFHDSVNYTQRSFSYEGAMYSTNNFVDSCTIRIDDLDSSLMSSFGDEVVQGSEVTLQKVVLDENYATLGTNAFTIFIGEIDDWDIDEETLIVTLVSELSKWDRSTLYRHSTSCRWKKFKGVDCIYAGGQSACDRTYNTCKNTMNNSDEFGGFPFIADIMNKELWWGRSSSLPDK